MSEFELDLLQTGRRVVPFSEEDDGDSEEAARDEAAPPAREGLPSSYRMRADPHYVDELTSARLAGSNAPAMVALSDVRATDDPATAARAERVFERLKADLATIHSLAARLTEDASPLTRRLHVDLLQAESWRARWLVQAHAILSGQHRLDVKPRQLGPFLEAIRQGFAPEARLNHVPLQVRASDWSASVRIDETAVSAAIAGAILATFGLLVGDREGAAPLRVSVEALAGELRTIEVSQQDLDLPAAVTSRFFDVEWVERPGGWLAAMGAATARAVARQQGGHAALLRGDGPGTVIRLNLTAAH